MNTVDPQEREELLKETIARLESIYRPLKILGLGRFDINSGQIVRKSRSSMMISILILLVVHSTTYYITYELTKINYLLGVEILVMLDFLAFHTFVISNTFVNRYNAMRFLNTGIDLDLFLGLKETNFMRDATSNVYFVLYCCVGFAQLLITLVLYFTYVVELSVTIAGGILFSLLFFIYYDYSFFISLYTTLTLRVRYLNVAIMKLANVNLEYLPQQFPFNTLFWDKKFDSMVDFHLRANTENFAQAFAIIFNQLSYLEKCYRFTMFCCLSYLTAGTFLTVQIWIIWAKSLDVDILRVLTISSWCLMSWAFQFGLCQQPDMFTRQVDQTSLICTFIQLKPIYPDEIYKLTARIIRMLEVRDRAFSIYGIFYFNTGLLLRITSSIIVYITMQLQIGFPAKGTDPIVNNSTINNI